MEENRIEIRKNPEATALEIATKRIRKGQCREKGYRILVLLLSVLLIITSISWAIDEEECELCKDVDAEGKCTSVDSYESREPKTNLLLRERTMKRGVY